MRIVSFNITHDSSVCSYVDGKIEFYCKEERISRKKRDSDPYLCLKKYREQNFGKIDHFLYLTPSNNEPYLYDQYSIYIDKMFNVKLENYSSLNHHNCHAGVAFYNSGFSEALVFVIDRNGSIFFDNGGVPIARESESAYIGSYIEGIQPIYKSFWSYQNAYKHKIQYEIKKYYDSNNIKNLDINVNNSWSIVKVYESASTLIGVHPIDNGKTMGLSSYGEEREYEKLFIDGNPISEYFTCIDLTNIGFEQDTSCFYGHENKITDNINENNFQFYANKAKHVQLETQEQALKLIKKYVEKTNIKNVCLSGGYGLNVVANNFYIKNLPDVNFYFEPLSDDSGITIGACMLKYREETLDKKTYTQPDNFYHYYDHSDTRIFGEKVKIDDLSNILINQKILAIFDGIPESGPRALGHRSLLFDPRNINGKEIVNTLKNREWYRPFAGIVLEDYAQDYFDMLGLTKSEFMTISFDSKNEVEKYVPAIVHVDGTCRIQTVSKKDKFLFDLLNNFYIKTGCPMLLNTSFNLAGDPLIQTKDDVVCFMKKIKSNNFFGGTYFVDSETLLTN